MKLHLPGNLRKSVLRVLSAVAFLTLASGTTWASDSTQITTPSGYTEVLVDSLDDITPYSSSATDVAFRLTTDLTVDARSSSLMTNSAGSWYCTSDSVDALASIIFSNGAVQLFNVSSDEKLEFNQLNSTLFELNTNVETSSSVEGIVIKGTTIALNNSGSIRFLRNRGVASVTPSQYYYNRYAYGGGIAVNDGGLLTMSGNTSVDFSDNSMSASAEAYSFVGGGAIYSGIDSEILLTGNGDVNFSGNSGISGNYARGGAICVEDSGLIALQDNGSVLFNGNGVSVENAEAYSYHKAVGGGAIYAGRKSEILLIGNHNVCFSNNAAQVDSDSSAGGAICGYNGSSVNILDNISVTFNANKVVQSTVNYFAGGGAVYAFDLNICNNDSVLFEKNAEVTEGVYRLRSIYNVGWGGRNVSLSAAEGKKIEFRDSIYIDTDTTFNLNADYTDADGNTIKQTGDIIFTGATTEADLLEVKGSAGTDDEIRLSRTSEVNTVTNLYGGRLRVEAGAVYQGLGITVADGANATLLLQDGTLNHAGYGITISSGSTLSAIGENTINASTLTVQAGGTLHLALDMAQPDSVAVLTTTGNLAMDSILLNLTGTEYLVEGDYKLLTRTEGAAYDISGWELSGVTSNQLSWENGTLYYAGGHDWNHGATDDDVIGELEEILGNLIINGGDITLETVIGAIKDKAEAGFGHGNGHIVINRGGIHITGDGGLEGHIIFNGDLKCIRELFIENDITNIKIELGGGVGTENIVDVQGESSVVVDTLSGEGSMRKNGKGEMLIHGNGHKVGGTLDVEEGQLTFGDGASAGHEAEIHELVVGKQDVDKEAKVKVEKDAKLKGDKLHVDGKNAVVTNEGSMEFTEEVKVKDGHLDNRGHISKITLEGGMVSGSGTFAGLTMSGGTFVVGNSPGVATLTDDLVATGGNIVFSVAGTEAATSATSGWEFDTHSQINMSGYELSLEEVAITIAFGGDMAMAEAGEYSLTLFTNVGNIADFDAEVLGVLAENTTFILSTEEGALTANITMMPEITSVDYTVQGNSIVLNYTVGAGAIPEPTTATLSLLALAALAVRRRRC